MTVLFSPWDYAVANIESSLLMLFYIRLLASHFHRTRVSSRHPKTIGRTCKSVFLFPRTKMALSFVSHAAKKPQNLYFLILSPVFIFFFCARAQEVVKMYVASFSCHEKIARCAVVFCCFRDNKFITRIYIHGFFFFSCTCLYTRAILSRRIFSASRPRYVYNFRSRRNIFVTRFRRVAIIVLSVPFETFLADVYSQHLPNEN